MLSIKKYLDYNINQLIDCHIPGQDDEQTIQKIKKFITSDVEKILHIEIIEDRFLEPEELKNLHRSLKNRLHFSKHRWIDLYVLEQKNKDRKMSVGIFGWSMGRANQYIFQQIIKDQEYQDMTETISIRLSELLQ